MLNASVNKHIKWSRARLEVLVTHKGSRVMLVKSGAHEIPPSHFFFEHELKARALAHVAKVIKLIEVIDHKA